MDQIKIGRYIAEKRKQLGLTQLQLAEKLGMSNKSVSKWERGVCMPDVAVYMKLCDVLGITLTVLTEYKLPLEGMNMDDWQALYGAAVQIPQKTVHLEKDEAGLLYLVYDKEMSASIPESIEKDGFWPKGKEKCQGIDANDYTDFITIKFNHVE